MKFRYDIGALRALAVLIVIFFHYQVPFFEGGFIGVDVFFVISGYLMTRIVLEGFEKNKFSLLDFYNRRFIRIIPPLLVMIGGILIATYFLYFPIDFKQVSLYSGVSILFVSNLYYLFNSGYFDAASQTNILLHTWSLSVEWQFYMLYPIMLMFVRKIYINNKKVFSFIFILTALLSFLLVLWFNNFLPTTYSRVSFFFVTHRAWEMMIGGLAFIYAPSFENLPVKIRRVIVISSLIILLFCLAMLNESSLWPSSLTIIPVITSFLIIACNVDFVIFRNSIIQYLGNISYSLYLWHWPVYVLFKYRDYSFTGEAIVFFIISLLLAVLTYRYVESKSKLLPVNKTLIGICLLILICVAGNYGNINSVLYPQKIISLTEYKENYESTRQKQFNSRICHNVNKINYNKCLCVDKNKKNILLIGDSHAGQLSLSFRTKIDTSLYNFMEHTVVGAFPLRNSIGNKEAKMQFHEIYEDFLSKVSANEIQKVIISANWLNYKSRGYESKEDLVSSIDKTIKYFEERDIDFAIIGQSEEYNIEFPKVLSFSLIAQSNHDYIKESSRELNDYLKSKVRSNYINVFLHPQIEKYDAIKNVPYMFDDDHLSIFGADQLVDILIQDGILESN